MSSADLDSSFDEQEGMDASTVIASELYGPSSQSEIDYAAQQHIKKLSEAFESCARNNDSNQMKVFLRIRPLSSDKPGDVSSVTVNNSTTITTMAPDSSKRAQYTKTEERTYTFSRVFGPNTNQSDIFAEVGKPLLERFLRGDTCVLFAYGMTNSGKTHTIQGIPSQPGLLPRIVDHVLGYASLDSKGNNSYDLSISMLEIYQEKVYDLLSKKRDKLTIRDGNGHVEVLKLSSAAVTSSVEAVKLLEAAANNRSKSNTLLNSGSSRSHAVCTLTLKTTKNGVTSSSVFHVVDLAGAERSNRTKANFLQLKEANNINLSLMQLWKCLQSMRKKTTDGSSSSNDVVSYRDSKLTHLLMPELGRAGAAGVSMITCVNPHNDDYDETISILGNASLAYKITELADIGRPVVPEKETQPQSMFSSILSHFNQSATEQAAKQALANKRKRDQEAAAASTTAANTAINALSKKVYNVAPKLTRKNSVTTISLNQPTASAASTFRGSSIVSSASSLSSDNSSDDVQELKRLRSEVTRLEKENQSLQKDQIQKESEIRIEIATELSKRSDGLLQQIKKLQNELADRDAGDGWASNDSSNAFSLLQRSAKKARKNQIDRVNEETFMDLHQLQEEYDQMKAFYEQQISDLQDEKKEILAELQDWKSRAQASSSTLQQLQIEVARDLSPSSGRSMVSTSGVEAQIEEEKKSKKSKKSNEGTKGKKKSSSIRSQLAATLNDSRPSNEATQVSTEKETNTFSNRMNLRNASVTGKPRSPLTKTSFSNSNTSTSPQIQPLFPPKSSRPMSPVRSKSPNQMRSTSPSKAPFVVKNINSSSNDENTSNVPLFGQVTLNNPATLTEATNPDGSTYFKRLRSNFVMRA